MEVNSSKCAQGKVTFRTSERRRYPERGSHPHILIGQCSTVARTYWVHCTRGARFDLLIMLPEISDAHTHRYVMRAIRNAMSVATWANVEMPTKTIREDR